MEKPNEKQENRGQNKQIDVRSKLNLKIDEKTNDLACRYIVSYIKESRDKIDFRILMSSILAQIGDACITSTDKTQEHTMLKIMKGYLNRKKEELNKNENMLINRDVVLDTCIQYLRIIAQDALNEDNYGEWIKDRIELFINKIQEFYNE